MPQFVLTIAILLCFFSQKGPLGVAMGNAVDEVKAAAGLVVADNDSHGVAEAIERLIL